MKNVTNPSPVKEALKVGSETISTLDAMSEQQFEELSEMSYHACHALYWWKNKIDECIELLENPTVSTELLEFCYIQNNVDIQKAAEQVSYWARRVNQGL